jgi:hypothetical protein
MTTPRAITLGTLILTIAYAVVRYNVFKAIAWHHLPLFVLNKAVAWTATTLLLIAAVRAVARRENLLASPWLGIATGMGAVHVLMSLVLLSPERYASLYDASRQLSWVGELALLGGVVATVSNVLARRHKAAALFLPVAIVLHCTALGAHGWLTPSQWPGYMPPITLVCAVTATAASVIAARAIHRVE